MRARTTSARALVVYDPAGRRLPQVANLLPILRRGIGLHHSGLLPILKAERCRLTQE